MKKSSETPRFDTGKNVPDKEVKRGKGVESKEDMALEWGEDLDLMSLIWLCDGSMSLMEINALTLQ